MKKTLSYQSIILLLAILLALIITSCVGISSVDPVLFFWNTFWVNITFIGDGFFVVGLFFFLLFYFNKQKMAYKLFFVSVFVMLIVQLLKNIFSNNHLQIFFEVGTYSNNTENLFSHNFISSHTTLAFTLALFFSMEFKKAAYTFMFFVVAILVACSRVVLVGESVFAICLSILPTLLSYTVLKKMNTKGYSNKGYFIRGNKFRKINNQPILEV
jgi:membrane-associated phospholipid phosphatase